MSIAMPAVRRALYIKYPLRQLRSMLARFRRGIAKGDDARSDRWYRDRANEVESILLERTGYAN